MSNKDNNNATTLLPSENIAQLLEVNGVMGYTLTTSMGEILASNIEDDGLNEFIAFLSGMLPNLSEQASMGIIHQAIFKNARSGNLLMLTDGEQSLGITTKSRASTQDICQQAMTLLHWN